LTLRGEAALSIPIYERVIARTENPELMDALAGVLLEQGETERANELVARAREGWEARLALFPEAAYGHAIDHFAELEDDPERTVALAEANAEARPNGESKTILAGAYLSAGQTDDAKRVIDEVLASPWDTAEAHAIASQIYADLNDEARAASERERAVAMNPHAMD
jgi:tetratricopeptide (TPR) repeat protein